MSQKSSFPDFLLISYYILLITFLNQKVIISSVLYKILYLQIHWCLGIVYKLDGRKNHTYVLILSTMRVLKQKIPALKHPYC